MKFYSGQDGNRFQITHLLSTSNKNSFANDVRRGLSSPQKWLYAKYFYDERGSELFEKICELPEYYLTRTEVKILKGVAKRIFEIVGPSEIIELGSGSSTKTRLLLDAVSPLGYSIYYLPVDVNLGMLTKSAESLLEDYPSLRVHALVADYEKVWGLLPTPNLPTRFVLFLGSTIGNLNREDSEFFLTRIASSLRPGDYFLLSTDLQKPKDVLEAAYNDVAGVTAEFNLNILRRINRELGANFDLKKFKHLAIYNQELHQIEMHLRSLIPQTVTIKLLEQTVPFRAGETIHTEISRKFDLEEVQNTLREKGLSPVATWTDKRKWFGLTLARRS